MYQKDILREYVKNSVLREHSASLKVRLSKELAKKYDNGIYDNYLKELQSNIESVESLNIILPGNANPVFYLYIVPDENFDAYLRIPPAFSGNKKGGKPVNCYDNDGFNSAYGISQNVAEDFNPDVTIDKKVNNIHEVAHIFQHHFYMGNQVFGEGFAETIPLYGLDLEKNFDKHKDLLRNLKEEDIRTAKELIEESRNGNFGEKVYVEKSTCSFRESYISSYLLVRGIIETIKDNTNCSKEEAIQIFLEFIKSSPNNNEYLVADVADFIGVPIDMLLNGKDLQISTINKIIEEKQIITK